MIFDQHSPKEILKSLESESAKALSEVRCAKEDLAQAETRLKFILATIHYLKTRD